MDWHIAPITGCGECRYWRKAGRDKAGEQWNGRDHWAGTCYVEPTISTRFATDPPCRYAVEMDALAYMGRSHVNAYTFGGEFGGES